MTTIQERWYQTEAIAAINNHLATKRTNPCLVLPTGSGKSPTAARMIRDWCVKWPSTRVCVLAHTKELVLQNARSLVRWWPEGSIGVYSAGLNSRDTKSSVIFAGIQSVHKRALELDWLDVIVVDECHRIPADGEGQYRTFIADAKKINDNVRVIGMTATPYRLGVGKVCGPGKILNEICYEVGVAKLIEQGYLCNLIGKPGVQDGQADVSGVRIRNGEYKADDLEQAVNKLDVVEAACAEIVQRFADRKAWLIFCAGIDHAKNVSDALDGLDIEAPVISSKTSKADRDELIERYKARDLRCLVTVNILSEGFDAPHVDAIAMLRPTKSPGLYYQQIGRGFRIDPGKSDCLVLDYAGNIAEHGPVDNIKPPKTKGLNGKDKLDPGPLVKACPECQELVPIKDLMCRSCGYIWPSERMMESTPDNGPKHSAQAADAPILSRDIPRIVNWHDVDDVHYSMHTKANKPPSMRVDYTCGMAVFSEWICVEHTGYARQKAARWWFDRAKENAPSSVDDALQVSDRLPVPSAIEVDETGRFADIKSYRF